MTPLRIQPFFTRGRNMIEIPTSEMNAFTAQEIRDNSDFYQATFGVFNWMPFNKTMKYVLHSMYAHPFVWQKDTSCSWDETGSLRMDRTEISPCYAKLNEGLCDDELLNECLKVLWTWGGGQRKLDAKGVQIMNQMYQVLATNYTMAARNMLAAGQLFDLNQITWQDGVTNELKDLISRTNNTCKGWLELLRQVGATPGNSHVNIPNFFTSSMFDGNVYVGDVVELKDALQDHAKSQLQNALDEGGLGGTMINGIVPAPMIICSPSVVSRAAKQYRELCVNITCINPRLTRKEYPWKGSVINVYFVDNVPLIPQAACNEYTQYFTGQYHFAYLSLGRNLNLGGDFGNIPTLDDPIAITIQKSLDVKDQGKIYIDSRAMFATGVADLRFITGAQAYTE